MENGIWKIAVHPRRSARQELGHRERRLIRDDRHEVDVVRLEGRAALAALEEQEPDRLPARDERRREAAAGGSLVAARRRDPDDGARLERGVDDLARDAGAVLAAVLALLDGEERVAAVL